MDSISDVFVPMPVMMIVSKNSDDSERCSPFSWGTPVSKDGLFMISMRKESKTLLNITDGRSIVTVSWLPATLSIAQMVLMTKSPNPEPMKLTKANGWKISVPAIAVASIYADAVWLDSTFSGSTHIMVFMRPLDTRMVDSTRLLHLNGKVFGRMIELKPVGY